MDDVARSIVARLCDAPDDEQLLGVLADHLLARGDPRAQVIALELAGQYEEARRLVDAHLASSLPAQLRSSYAEIRWHRGFLYTLNLSDSRLPPNADERDLPSALRATLAHPSAALLRELIVSSTPRMRFNEVVAALADEGAPCLRQLEIGSARGRYRMVSARYCY